MYRVFRYAKDGTGYYEEGFLEDLKLQMSYIIGPSVQEEPQDQIEEGIIHWVEEGPFYHLVLNEQEAQKLFQILSAVEHPGEGFDKGLNQKLMDQMMETAPAILSNLTVINR
jgi:heat shock protein HspQ